MADPADEDVNTLLLDQLLQHAVYLERYKQQELQGLQKFLRQLQKDVTGLLAERYAAAATGKVRTARLQALLTDLGKLSDQASEALTDHAQAQLRELSAYEGRYLVTAVQQALPVQLDFTTVAPAQLWAAATARPFEGRLLSQWVQDYSAATRARLQQAVRISVVEGETLDQAVRRLTGLGGVLPGVTQRTAEALVRTAIAHVVSEARQATLEANEAVVSGVQWHSTLDRKTSLICISRDGRVYPLRSGPRPPGHPNCRSTTVPVLKSWQELGLDLPEAAAGTRASMSGQVPASTTYATWLRRQSSGFQEDVLGVKRAQLFRQGRLDVAQFVDHSGHVYTLAELQAKHPAAF